MAGLRHSFWLRAHLAAVLPWAALMSGRRPFGGFAGLAVDALNSYVMAVIAGAVAVAALAALAGLWSRWWRGPVPSPEEFAMPTSAAGTPRRGGGSGGAGRPGHDLGGLPVESQRQVHDRLLQRAWR